MTRPKSFDYINMWLIIYAAYLLATIGIPTQMSWTECFMYGCLVLGTGIMAGLEGLVSWDIAKEKRQC